MTGLCILLMDSVIDIACFILSISKYESFMVIAVGVAWASTGGRSVIVAVSTRFFLGYPLGLNLLDAVFFL